MCQTYKDILQNSTNWTTITCFCFKKLKNKKNIKSISDAVRKFRFEENRGQADTRSFI